jgi:hypothetical protein
LRRRIEAQESRQLGRSFSSSTPCASGLYLDADVVDAEAPASDYWATAQGALIEA